MSRHNTRSAYGSVAKAFHWLTALLILTVLPLGIVARNMADALTVAGATPGDAAIARVALLFSIHKTLGLTVFFVALARIAWAFGQAKPGLINGNRRAEALAAETVHWLLYGSLVAVPLSGWVQHAATTGFAPIWWPFGQDLPLVPKGELLAERVRILHYLLQWVLAGAIILHVAGALKHHLIDRDATLRRMLPGAAAGEPARAQPGHALPLVTALAIWAAVLGGATAMGGFAARDSAPAPAPALAQAESDWLVETGELKIAIRQLGSRVEGNFTDWTAAIDYTEVPDSEGRHGSVEVTVAIESLTLGAVTSQALGAGNLEAAAHPTARFTAEIISGDQGLEAQGTLQIKTFEVPLVLPFVLTLDGDSAQASGSATVDRRDFAIAEGMRDEGSLGFAVEIAFALRAIRSQGAS